MCIGIVQVEIGTVIIHADGGFLTKIKFSDEKLDEIDCGIFTTQIKEYFQGTRKKFDFKVKITTGGPIFKKVWEYVKEIPYGTTETYGEIAKKLNINPRVVGYAMASNSLPLYIPCHRVVSKNGIGGFYGGLKWKEFLLNLERKFSQ
jgi:methylated-DNA-[protein]-cysteine S-methyltransferase